MKYYSVDMPHGHCGEACITVKHFWFFKIFEANLTLADSRSDNACAKQFTGDGRHWSVYQQTVTHGDPFGLVAVTLDLYGAGANMTSDAVTGGGVADATASRVEAEAEAEVHRSKSVTVRSSKESALHADLTETEKVEYV
jgi:hypothetical protein